MTLIEQPHPSGDVRLYTERDGDWMLTLTVYERDHVTPDPAPLCEAPADAWETSIIYERDEREAWRNRLFEDGNPACRKRWQRIGDSLNIAMALLGQAIRLGDAYMDPVIHPGPDGPMVMNRHTGEILEAGPGEMLAIRCALLHLLHADPANHWVGDVWKKRGKAYLGPNGEPAAIAIGGPLRCHSSRLCADQMEARRLIARRKARAGLKLAESRLSILERTAQAKGWHWRPRWVFLTQTMPHVPTATSEMEVKRFNRSQELLRKRDAWRLHVYGGTRGLEDKLTHKGNHVHGHTIALMRYWEEEELRREWFKCVAVATQEIYGLRMSPQDGVKGGIVVDVREIRAKGRVKDPDKEIALADALKECVKYITKPSDLALIDADVLLAIELVPHWGRMFEVFGCCRKGHDGEQARLERALLRAKRAVADLRAKHREARGRIEEELEEVRSWIRGEREGIARLEARRAEACRVDPRAFRPILKALRADLARLRNGAQAMREERETLRARQAKEEAVLRAALERAQDALRAYREGREAQTAEGGISLDTARVSDGGFPETEDSAPLAEGGPLLPAAAPEPQKAPRPPSWRDLMYQLPLSQWIRVMLERTKSARIHMARVLAQVFEGTLFSLDGRCLAYAPL